MTESFQCKTCYDLKNCYNQVDFMYNKAHRVEPRSHMQYQYKTDANDKAITHPKTWNN